jgi:hypothetical protein
VLVVRAATSLILKAKDSRDRGPIHREGDAVVFGIQPGSLDH